MEEHGDKNDQEDNVEREELLLARVNYSPDFLYYLLPLLLSSPNILSSYYLLLLLIALLLVLIRVTFNFTIPSLFSSTLSPLHPPLINSLINLFPQ